MVLIFDLKILRELEFTKALERVSMTTWRFGAVVTPREKAGNIIFIRIFFFFASDFIDLSDESGSLKHLQRYPLDYGTKHLNEREIFILVKGESTKL